MDFQSLKANRNKSIEELQKELESLDNKKKFIKEDTHQYWNPALDKAGLCMAEVRFLPTNEEDGKNIIKHESWAVKGPSGKWYINDSRRNLGEDDPAQRYANIEWARAKNAGQDRPVDSPMKKNKFYIANIYVLSDKTNPENEGKVLLWKFGEQVYKKIKAAMFPEFESDSRINIFDFWEGANFRVKLSTKKVGDKEYRNYEACNFANQSEFMNGDEEKIKKIWASQQSLKEFLDPTKYKSYDELAKRLSEVLDIDIDILYDKNDFNKLESIKKEIPEFKSPPEIKSSEPSLKNKEKEVESPPWDDDDEFLKSLGEDD